MSLAITVNQVLETPGAAEMALGIYHFATDTTTFTVDGLLQAVSSTITRKHGKPQSLTATVLAYEWLRQHALVVETETSPGQRVASGYTWSGRRIQAYFDCKNDPEQFVRLVDRWLDTKETK